jgi:hypothetical protein
LLSQDGGWHHHHHSHLLLFFLPKKGPKFQKLESKTILFIEWDAKPQMVMETFPLAPTKDKLLMGNSIGEMCSSALAASMVLAMFTHKQACKWKIIAGLTFLLPCP